MTSIVRSRHMPNWVPSPISISSTSVVTTPTAGSSHVTTLTSASVSPPASALVVVIIAGGVTNNSGMPVTAMTDSLATHLNWTQLCVSSNNNCGSNVWIADSGSTAPGAFTVTATFGSGAAYEPYSVQGFWVLVLQGAKAVARQNGATGTSTTSGGGTANVTMTALKGNNSLIIAAVGTHGSTLTPAYGTKTQVLTVNSTAWSANNSSNEAWWVMTPTVSYPGGTAVSMAATISSANTTVAAVEILAGV